MNAVPEKFYYVPLPRVRVRGVRQLLRLRMRLVWQRCRRTISDAIVGAVRWSHTARRAAKAWSRTHTLNLALWILGLARTVVRTWQTARRSAKAWWRARRLDAAMCVFVLGCGVVVALIAVGVI